MKEWSKAALFAIVLLVLLHLFVVRWVIVESTSMYATLLPGDILLVQRHAKWTGFQRNDIVVFSDPISDHLPMLQRPLLVKRIAGMPGDKVQLRNGDLFVNGAYIPPPATSTVSYRIRTDGTTPIDGMMKLLRLPIEMMPEDEARQMIPLNEPLAHELRSAFPSIEVEPMESSTGAPRNIFPFSQQHRWNNDDFGPLRVPAKGDTIDITMHDLPLYDRIITHYEGHVLGVSGDTLMMDGAPLTTYVIEKDHYFVLGDSRDHSADSRYWGFVPEDHLIGKASHIITSSSDEGIRLDRSFKMLR